MNQVVRRYRLIYRWALAIMWMGIIFYLSSQPITAYPELVPDYVAHLFEYAILALLLWRALSHQRQSARNLYLEVILLTSAYGLTDEIHQIFVPTRTFSLMDLAVDTLAAFSVVLLGYLFTKIFRFS